MNNFENNCCDYTDDSECIQSLKKDINVGLPITIKPFCSVGNIKTRCIEGSVLCKSDSDCCYDSTDSCEYVIMQTLSIEIPVVFGATAETKDLFVDCGCDEDDCGCCDCDD